MIYGYIRVSTKGQAKNGNSLDDQCEAILSRYAGAEIIKEASSGAKTRPIFDRLVGRAKRGDVLVVTKLDRFCRTTKEGLQYIDDLMNRGVIIHILNMGLIEDTPMGRLIITNLLAFAEFERSMILERTQAGKEIAKLNPEYKEGRKAVQYDKDLFRNLAMAVNTGVESITSAARKLGVSRAKWYRIVKEVEARA